MRECDLISFPRVINSAYNFSLAMSFLLAAYFLILELDLSPINVCSFLHF